MTLYKLSTESNDQGVQHSWHPSHVEALTMHHHCSTEGDFEHVHPVQKVRLPFFLLCRKRALCHWLNQLTNPAA